MNVLKGRIAILDGFRFIAISMVILFHFLSKCTYPGNNCNCYPYGDQFSNLWLSKYGYLGVHFFFIISGFVIIMTLERCNKFLEFIMRRLSRLLPALLVCSVVTFTLINLFGPKNISINSFLPSLTFTDPFIWKFLTKNPNLTYVDGAYWSLVVEMKFYILVAIIFFINKERFLRNWIIFVIILVAFNYLLKIISIQTNYTHFKTIQEYFQNLFITKYLLFFSFGIYFYNLFQRRKLAFNKTLIFSALVVLQMILLENLIEILIFSMFIALFIIFIYKEKWLTFLCNPLIAKIGLISYPLYLIHQNVGGLIIYKIDLLYPFGDTISVLLLIPVLVTLLLFSVIVHYFIEDPANFYLKKRLSKIYRSGV